MKPPFFRPKMNSAVKGALKGAMAGGIGKRMKNGLNRMAEKMMFRSQRSRDY